MPQKPSLKDALKFWIKLGFISFGGPAGQIAIMHEYLVQQKKMDKRQQVFSCTQLLYDIAGA